MKKDLATLGEWELIRQLTRDESRSGPGLRLGIGDDAAVLAPSKHPFLVTTDLMQEHVHFERKWATWEDVAYKALQINLSDIAAMGGRPRFYWLNLSLPANFSLYELRSLRKGLRRASREAGVTCAGGDTSRSRRDVTIGITLLGEAGKRITYRKGARIGDAIYVTGYVGEAALGLRLLRTGKTRLTAAKPFCRRLTRPRARVQEGQALSTLGVRAMIDISDGVAADLRHILDESQVGAELDLSSLPIRPAFARCCQHVGVSAVHLQLSGGEDYELLFCATPRQNAVIQRLSKRLKLPMTQIGRIVSGRQLKCYDEHGKRFRLKELGYDHFK